MVSANSTSLISSSGKEAQKTILRAVADLNLIVKRKQQLPTEQNQQSYQSPAKISRRGLNYQYSSSSSDTSEDTDDNFIEIHGTTNHQANQPTSNQTGNIQCQQLPRDRLKGMDLMLKFDSGIKEVKLFQSGREFIYSGSCRATISGMFYIWNVLYMFYIDI